MKASNSEEISTEINDYLSTPQSKWLKDKIKNSPFTTGIIVCWNIFIIIGKLIQGNPSLSGWMMIASQMIYTWYAARLRDRSLLWWLLWSFWLIIISILPIKWEKVAKLYSSSSGLPFLIGIWILWLGAYWLLTSNYIAWLLSFILFIILIWYIKKK